MEGKTLYCYREQERYDANTGWGWFSSDEEAIESFKKDITVWTDSDYYIGKLVYSDKISQDPPTEKVCILTEEMLKKVDE